ncbi:hypothetical protein Tco_0212914 [Tanacetum coccineum]
MSSYTHPSIPSNYDVEDAFSSTNTPNNIPTSPSYSPVTPGNISPDSSDDLKISYPHSVLPPSSVLLLSPMFDSRDFFPSEKISSPKDA